MEKFDLTKEAIKGNILFLEEVEKIDYEKLSSSERDYLLSQYKKTIGSLYLVIQKYGNNA